MEKQWLLCTLRVQKNKTPKSCKNEENMFQGSWIHEINSQLDTWSIMIELDYG